LSINTLPTFFDQIKAPTNGITRTSSNTSVATVDTNGLLEGKSHGTATITVTIRDIYGNTAQATATVTVQNKISLTCNLTYQPTGRTNQNVTATLTGCNKPITITNNGGNTTYTFTTNGTFTFTFQDAYGNT
jgi:membrane protease subunit (stomatin/prohibitin family)